MAKTVTEAPIGSAVALESCTSYVPVPKRATEASSRTPVHETKSPPAWHENTTPASTPGRLLEQRERHVAHRGVELDEDPSRLDRRIDDELVTPRARSGDRTVIPGRASTNRKRTQRPAPAQDPRTEQTATRKQSPARRKKREKTEKADHRRAGSNAHISSADCKSRKTDHVTLASSRRKWEEGLGNPPLPIASGRRGLMRRAWTFTLATANDFFTAKGVHTPGAPRRSVRGLSRWKTQHVHDFVDDISCGVDVAVVRRTASRAGPATLFEP